MGGGYKAKIKSLKEAEGIYKSKPNKTNAKKLEQKQMAVVRLDMCIKKIKNELIQQKKLEQFLENEYCEIKSNYRYCGLKKEEHKKQYKKKRDRNTAGYRRSKEANCNKIDVMIKMLKRTVNKGFIPDYVLTDTWFFSRKIWMSQMMMSQPKLNPCQCPCGCSTLSIIGCNSIFCNNPYSSGISSICSV